MKRQADAMTTAWLHKAAEDLAVSQELLLCGSNHFGIVGFHCQQAVEKYLKALLVHKALPITRTHDLARLLQQVTAEYGELTISYDDAIWLGTFAVEARYPGPQLATTRDHAQRALAIAQTVKDSCSQQLGITE